MLNPNYSESWPDPKLNEEQLAKCLLLDIVIWADGDMEGGTTGRYVIGRINQNHSLDMYVRPIDHDKNPGMHIFVDSIDECFLLALNPENYGGQWGA